MVGLTGFEPATSAPPVRRANQAAPQPATVRYGLATITSHSPSMSRVRPASRQPVLR